MEHKEANMATTESPIVKKRCSCMKVIFWTGAVIVGIASILGGYLYMYMRERDIPKEIYDTLGLEGVQMFVAHDRDGDGYLSIEEYEALYHRLVGRNANVGTFPKN